MQEHGVAPRAENREQTAAGEHDLLSRLAMVEAHLDAIQGRVYSFQSQILQRSGPDGVEFSDLLDAIQNGLAALRAAVSADAAAMGRQLARAADDLAKIGARLSRTEAEFAQVRKELRLGDEETRRYMRVLHEDLIERLTLLRNDLGQRSRLWGRKG